MVLPHKTYRRRTYHEVLDTTDEYPKGRNSSLVLIWKANSLEAWISSSKNCESDSKHLQALLISFSNESNPSIFLDSVHFFSNPPIGILKKLQQILNSKPKKYIDLPKSLYPTPKHQFYPKITNWDQNFQPSTLSSKPWNTAFKLMRVKFRQIEGKMIRKSGQLTWNRAPPKQARQLNARGPRPTRRSRRAYRARGRSRAGSPSPSSPLLYIYIYIDR